ncbi:flagellar hook-length control protein FliK [Roseicitreum antarcticum]|uniref:Hook-length control protein FliK n=1 Tax=Roseicitreum antarcticum TaxID=564137 RepID=A0A1H2XAS4_9RHOB|nr:flagellar hook-length control protein FliK [Roseicitreum antarcticum]SDW89858.1 hook-length control protein FliK [Roseicitreum antarcticum]
MIDLPISQTKVHDSPRVQASVTLVAADSGPAGAGRQPFTLGHGMPAKPDAPTPTDPTEEVEAEGDTGAEGAAPTPVARPFWAVMDSVAINTATNMAMPRADAVVPSLPGTTPGAQPTVGATPSAAMAAAELAPAAPQEALPGDAAPAQSAVARPGLAMVLQTAPLPVQTGTPTHGIAQVAATAPAPDSLSPNTDMSALLNVAGPAATGPTTGAAPRATDFRLPVPFRLLDAFGRPEHPRRSDAYRAPDQRIPLAPGGIDFSVPTPPPVIAARADPGVDITADRRQGALALDTLPAGTTIGGSVVGSFGGNAQLGIAGGGIMGCGAASANPAAITAQVATALSQAPLPGVIELTLSPAELGPLRIAMQAGDGVMMVAISADNAQTLDLMRRNSDLLLQEFRNLGHSNVAFQFSGSNSRDQGQRAPSGKPGQAGFDPISALPTTATAAPRIKADGLDLRL